MENRENMGAMEVISKEKEKTNKYAAACAIIASIISILLGYDTGVMSGAMLFIKTDLKTSDTQLEVLAGILNLFALVGSLIAGRTSDCIGRRYTIVVASVIFFIGSVLMGLAPSYPMLITGRCVAGIGVGFSLLVAPVYSAEISSPAFRGKLTSLPEICISFGILLGYVSNYAFSKLPLRYGWRTMLGIGVIPSAALAVGILAMPESPRWLVMKGRVGDARKVLGKVSNTAEEARLRLVEIKAVVGIDKDCEDDVVDMKPITKSGKEVWKELFVHPTPTVRAILIGAFGIHFFQHLTGIEAVILYSPRIFQKAGIHDKDLLLLATVAVGVTKTIFILTAVLLVDRFGRKPLLLTSTAGAAFSLTVLGIGLTVIENSPHKLTWAASLCVSAVLSYIAFFSVGLGPVTWVYTSEIFPLRLRAQGVSVCVAINRLMNGSMSMSFISLYKAISIGGVFFLFAGLAVVAWLFYFFTLPETKGKPLEEIEMLFEGRGCSCSCFGGRRENGEGDR